MVKYLVFGIGMMGEAIVYDILSNDDFAEVFVVEYDKERIEVVKNKWKGWTRVHYHHLSVEIDTNKIKVLLKEVDLAFGSIDYRYNLQLTKLCIETKTHYLDLGGNPEVVSNQYNLSDEAKKVDVTIIPDCGLAPGMANIIASGLIQTFESVDECHIRVGGLPQDPKGILKYQQVFSIRGLTNEYKEDAIVIRDEKIQSVPSMTELETLYFPEPFGEMEAFQTAGGTSSLPRLYEGKIKQLTYKTIRYPGHMQYFRFLLDFDLLSDEKIGNITPREIVERKLVEFLPKDQPDVVLIRVFVSGNTKNGAEVKVWECIDKSDTHFSAMARTTAYPISIIGQLICQSEIRMRGVIAGEEFVAFDRFVEELKLRNIVFTKSSQTLY